MPCIPIMFKIMSLFVATLVVVQSTILLFISESQNDLLGPLVSNLLTRNSHASVDSISCNEEVIMPGLYSLISGSKYFSRAMCTNNVNILIKHSLESLEMEIRTDVLNFATTSLFDFDKMLHAFSRSSLVLFDRHSIPLTFVQVMAKITLSNVVEHDYPSYQSYAENKTSTIVALNRHKLNILASEGNVNVNDKEEDTISLVSLSEAIKKQISDVAARASLERQVAAEKQSNAHSRPYSAGDCSAVLSAQDYKVLDYLVVTAADNSASKETHCALEGNSDINGDSNSASNNNCEATSSTSSPLYNDIFVHTNDHNASILSLPQSKTSRKQLLCMVYSTSTRQHNVNAIRSTWGAKCDGFIVWSNHTDASHSTVHLYNEKTNGAELYSEMWSKVVNIWSVVHGSNLLQEYEYFYLAGDDVYCIVENMRAYLNSRYIIAMSNNGSHPLYLGRTVPHNHYLTYNTGESGYILNAKAVTLLMKHINKPHCFPELSASMEDILIANCLRHGIGLLPTESRDSEGKERFHVSNLSKISTLATDVNRYEGMLKNFKLDLRGWSKESISYHLMTPNKYMRCVDDYLYHNSS